MPHSKLVSMQTLTKGERNKTKVNLWGKALYLTTRKSQVSQICLKVFLMKLLNYPGLMKDIYFLPYLVFFTLSISKYLFIDLSFSLSPILQTSRNLAHPVALYCRSIFKIN